MYAGHLGVALGAYSFRRTIPLWLLLIVAQLPDWLDAGVCLANGNRGPYGLYTHGIPVVSVLALGMALLYAIATRDGAGGVMIAGVTASHYALDYVTGLKPTWGGGPIIGLQLYDHPVVDLVLEGVVVLIGWWLYRRTLPKTLRNDGAVYAVLWLLLAVQVIVAGAALFFQVGRQMKC